MDWSWLFDILRSILFWLDTVIYRFIGSVYDVLNEIASVTIFNNDTINAISNKVYALLGIFMLFKVSFSILSYIVTPDDFYDKNKGFGKIITDIVVTLAILVVTPWIFNKAMEIQGIILRDNIIENIFVPNGQNYDSIDPGGNMAFTTFSAFFKVDKTLCNYEPGDPEYLEQCSALLGDYRRVYEIAYNYKDITTLANNSGIINIKTDDKSSYIMEYNYIISTLSGGFILLILILFCFDVGVRTIKLGFLRMVAPIPIISRIDPKKGKEVFDKFVKTCINTYLDLFIRLLSINLAVFVISILQVGIFDASNPDQTKEVSLLAMVFIILGALLFAKQFPQLLQDLLGIKLDGKFTLNPLKKLGGVPVVGGALAAGGAMALGAGLAGGRGLANLAGGGIKKGLGNMLGNDRLRMSGERTLANTTNAMKKRMANTTAEARARFQASGFAGGEFKGDTAHKLYAKEREKLRNQQIEGRNELDALDRQWKYGQSIRENLSDRGYSFSDFNGINDAAYNAVYKNQSFVNSLMAVDKQDSVTKAYISAYEKISQDKTVTVNGKTYHGATDADTFKEDYDKAQKILSGLEKTHDTMRKVYADDAAAQDAIKFNKNNPINPTKVR